MAELGAQALEVDRLLEDVAQRVEVHGIELVGREHPHQQIEGLEGGAEVEAVVLRHAVEQRGLQRRGGGGMRDAAPEVGERPAGAVASALGKAVGQHRGVHGAGAGRGDALDVDAAVLHQLVEHAPGEGAVRAAALQREVDGPDLGRAAPRRGRHRPQPRRWDATGRCRPPPAALPSTRPRAPSGSSQTTDVRIIANACRRLHSSDFLGCPLPPARALPARTCRADVGLAMHPSRVEADERGPVAHHTRQRAMAFSFHSMPVPGVSRGVVKPFTGTRGSTIRSCPQSMNSSQWRVGVAASTWAE